MPHERRLGMNDDFSASIFLALLNQRYTIVLHPYDISFFQKLYPELVA